MNEVSLSRENRRVMCEDEPRVIGTGCGERDGLRFQNSSGGVLRLPWMQTTTKVQEHVTVMKESF